MVDPLTTVFVPLVLLAVRLAEQAMVVVRVDWLLATVDSPMAAVVTTAVLVTGPGQAVPDSVMVAVTVTRLLDAASGYTAPEALQAKVAWRLIDNYYTSTY